MRKVVLMLAITAAALPWSAQASNHNLLPNPSFEMSAFEVGPVPPGTLSPQPLLPTGWAFEGAAALFDHWESGDLRSVHHGDRAIGISDPIVPREDICADPPVGCTDNPAYPATVQARQYLSPAPAWRTIQPIPLSAARTYTLSVWTQLEFGAPGFGAITFVRWLDANGVPIGISNGPSRQAPDGVITTPWAQISRNVTAPAAARSAVVLLGSDDLSLGQVRYDLAYFG